MEPTAGDTGNMSKRYPVANRLVTLRVNFVTVYRSAHLIECIFNGAVELASEFDGWKQLASAGTGKCDI